MAKEQPNVFDLLPLLESTDLHELEQVRGVLQESLSADKGSVLLNGLVDYYLDTGSPQAVDLLSSIREPHDKHLLDKMNECMAKPSSRLPTLNLLGHVVRKQPSWIHKIARFPLITSLLKCLKTESDVVVLITGVLVLVILLPMLQQTSKQLLFEFFDIFGRLAAWNQRNPGHAQGAYAVHLHASVYSFFHRLYGMYPCNFVSYLRAHYSMKENVDTFEEVVKPCEQGLEVTSSGMKEVMWSPSSTCGMSTPPNSRGMSPTTVSDLPHSASHFLDRVPSTPVDGKWTPSVSSSFPLLSGEPEHTAPPTSITLSLPKTSQEIKKGNTTAISDKGTDEELSPFSLNELSNFVKRTEREKEEDAITAELLTLTHEKLDQLPAPATDTSFCSTTDTPLSLNPSLYTLPHNLASTPDRVVNATKSAEQQASWVTWPCFTPIENSLSPSAVEDASLELFKGSFPYEHLFDLALPKLASLYVEKKTAECQYKGCKEEVGDLTATSPLEVLDRLIQQGHDLHEKVLKRSSSPNPSAESHLGGKHHSTKGKGSGFPDEPTLLRSQLLLLHNLLLYERHKREQHALRNRRLLRRVINATALEEQNNSMKAQLRLQEVEIQTLRTSLQGEQERSKLMQQEGEAQVQQLQSQLQKLQRERNDYSTQTQELRSDLQESKKRMSEMEAELQRANNKVCNTGHLLSQLTIKLNNSESLEQQVAFLNKQLLLLGEANKLSVQEVQRLGPDSHREQKMLQVCSTRETERLRQSSIQQNQRLEAAQQRINDLETQLTKKEHLILEQKKLLENVKNQAKGQLQASENRYLAQKHVTQVLQSEMLHLYSQLELANISTNAPAGGAAEPGSPQIQRPCSSNTFPSAQNSESLKREETSYVCVNGELSPLTPGSPLASALINGSQEEDLSVLSCNSPLAKSFLGIHNQELLKKTKSPCEEAHTHRLQDQSSEPAEKCTELTESQRLAEEADLPPVERHRSRAYNIQRRRQQDLHIMDYNEAQQEKT
ncbi:Hamartin [Bagarius yarrelli]|uniref:Hamartin n=1 Tax=Bagarius yarrelli TaxID=175774 RepID=A0A556V5V2_BAGYA|nr:Hamartin [Bagarius yarrelli]